jgi:hypothetical protein
VGASQRPWRLWRWRRSATTPREGSSHGAFRRCPGAARSALVLRGCRRRRYGGRAATVLIGGESPPSPPPQGWRPSLRHFHGLPRHRYQHWHWYAANGCCPPPPHLLDVFVVGPSGPAPAGTVFSRASPLSAARSAISAAESVPHRCRAGCSDRRSWMPDVRRD